MNYSVKFDNIELGNIIDVLQDFSPLSGVDWSPEFANSNGIQRGADFSYTSYKYKAIPMPFTMLGDLEEKYDQLQKILNVKEPKALIFESLPDRIFYAIPSGNLDFSENGPLGEGTITWIIPDGLSHAITEKSFQASANEEGILEAVVVNNGTEEVPISYDITMNHENGYIGIASEYGAMEYGQINERDEETKQKSEVLINYGSGDEIFQNLTKGGVYISPYINNGAFRVNTVDGVKYLEIDDKNVGGGSYWHGAGGYVKVPQNSNGHVGAKNWKASAKIWFQGTAARQMGDIDFCISKENQIIASFQIWDGQSGTYGSYVDMFIGNVKKGRFTYNADASGWSSRNDGQIYIQKNGELFTFGFGSERYQFREPSMKDVEADQVNIFFALMPGDTYWQMTWSCMEKLSFRTDSVDYIYDIPNRYPDGTVIRIDGESGVIYVDGSPHLEDEIVGTKYFKAPPGNTKIQFAYSDFCTIPPSITAKIREAYL